MLAAIIHFQAEGGRGELFLDLLLRRLACLKKI
jgi:hypothetical protein